MKITDDRARDLLRWLDDMAGDHALLLDEMGRYRDAAALIRQLQAAEQAAWHAGLDAGREQGRGKDHAHPPPSAPVGVDDALIAGAMEAAADACSRHVVCNEAITAAVEYALAAQPGGSDNDR